MSKFVRVVEPFFGLETGDILELTEDGNAYVFQVHEGSNGIDDNNRESKITYDAMLTISKDRVAELVEDEYLEYATEVEEPTEFVNIFTEIDRLLNDYNAELNNLDNEFKDKPACLKIEKQTVLGNLIKVLVHLKSLKK